MACFQFLNAKQSDTHNSLLIIYMFITLHTHYFQGGLWILNLVDYFGGSFIILVLIIFESASIIYIYGLPFFHLQFIYGVIPSNLLEIFFYILTYSNFCILCSMEGSFLSLLDGSKPYSKKQV